MPSLISAHQRKLCLLVGLIMAIRVDAAPTDIHTEPLAHALSAVKPNIMFTLDDSLSMYFQWTPDYVTDWSGASGVTFTNCRSQANDNSVLTASLAQCRFGDVPYNAYEFNTQYYNPNLYYRPSPAAGGLDDATRNMNRANTSNWTAVPNDQYGRNNQGFLYYVAQDTDGDYDFPPATTNLTAAVPDRVWCTLKTDDATNTNLCKTNADHSYPNPIHMFGIDPVGNIKYRYGAPYYYKIKKPQYCTDSTLTSCQAEADATHTVKAPVRFCTGSDQTDCKSKRTGSYTYPSFAGRIVTSGGFVPGTRATATLTVGDSGSNTNVTLASLLADGVELLNSPTTANGGTNTANERQNAAANIANRINARTWSHGYSATSPNNGNNTNVVTITAPAVGVSYNSVSLQQAYAAGTQASTGTITITNVANVSATNRAFSSVTVNGVNIFGTPALTLTVGNSAAILSAAANAIRDKINSYSNNTPWEYGAEANNNVVTIKAPLGMGAVPNGLEVLITKGSGVTASKTNMSGGVGAANMPITLSGFSGGTDATGPASYWSSTMEFERVDIVPLSGALPKTFPRGSERTDCESLTFCTYDEEMTNYANWYSYYRTRMQAAKSSAGRAFSSLSDSIRVGFITIVPSSGSSLVSGKYLKIADFAYTPSTDTGHKKNWYDKLYNSKYQTTGTPLREALSRVGRIYAGKTDGINSYIPSADDPVQYSCQPNFTILTTDGYWNGNDGRDLSNNVMANVDNVDEAPYSLSDPDGVYDGGVAGAEGTLADVALYYYKNDLRTDLANNVFTTTKDKAPHQHMTTFTLGLGLSGTLNFVSDYEAQRDAQKGDFYAITQGTLKWPKPVAGNETTLDDLWHAAVNGRGTFYSAANPQDFTNGLRDALTQMFARGGAGAAAATSNLQPTAGDNFAFTAEYETSTWRGDLVARTINTTNGVVSTVPLWSAASLLQSRNYTGRNIYTYDPTDTSGNRLKNFCWSSGGAGCLDGNGLDDDERAYFAPTLLGQSNNWTTAQTANASGINLVDFLRGDRSYESSGDNTGDTDLYRSRDSVLGDIINSQPAYMKQSPFNYMAANNPHYQAYKLATTTRRGTVYAAANDGMLHAFETDVNDDPYYQTAGIGTDSAADDTFTGTNTGNGVERWAYIPKILLPSMHKLAENPYTHRYFADGSPVIGDVCIDHNKTTKCAGSTNWRTILVAGLNSGGRGFYALDITDPLAPKALWEFSTGSTCLSDTEANAGNHYSDCNVGYSYGNPLIVKRPVDDRWVVIVSSGYNNFNPGDGKGYLYVLDAITGEILQRFSTGVGEAGTAANNYDDADPSGLGKINGWATNAIEDNVILAVYGGDLKGNVWRFDLDSTSANYNTVVKLATLVDASMPTAKPQPITTKPELGEVTPHRIVLVGTGRYLGTTDKTDASVQSIYALRDDQTNVEIDVRNNTQVLPRSLIPATATTRSTTAATAMDWLNFKGWRIDLPDAGERVNVDPQLQLGTLIIASNVPSTDTCVAGGYGWVNYFDYKQGTQVSTNAASQKVSTALIVGLSTIKLGSTVHTIVTTANNARETVTPPVSTSAIGGKRVSWRELISE